MIEISQIDALYLMSAVITKGSKCLQEGKELKERFLLSNEQV
jgi:hypothetical protein